MKKMVVGTCRDCANHCNATFKGWFNHYCEANGKSITKEECDGFPKWCPLEDDV